MAKNKIEIPRLILDHLLHYGDTSILGLGTLFYEQNSAYLSTDKSQIFPPSNTLKYKDTVENTDQFAQYVANRLGIKTTKALEKIDAYAQDLLNKLLNYGEVEIPFIGMLTKVEGRDVAFEESKGEVNSEYFGLPPVALKPIQYFKTGEVSEDEMAVSTADMPGRSKVAPLTDHTASTSIPSYNYNDEDDSNWLKPLFWILGLILLSALCYKGCEKYRSNHTNNPPVLVDKVSNNNDSTDPLDNNGKSDPSSNEVNSGDEDSQTSDNEVTTKAKPPTECVIILGAFESARNAMKMSSKISSLGYQPYEEYFDTMDLTRVGFKFECGEKDLREFIYEVRKDIAPDAWYLVPRITVE